MVGASAVSIGTGNFINPSLATDINEDIEKWLLDHNYTSIKEIVGIAVQG